MAALGSYSRPMPPALLMEQRFSRDPNAPLPAILAMRNIRLAIFSETAEGQKIDPAICKLLSGGDELTGRGMHGKTLIRFKPSASVVISTNHLPRASASDYAFWQRLRVIEFKRRYVLNPNLEKGELLADISLSDKFKDCGPAILAKLVRGCLSALRDGLAPPLEVTQAVAFYQHSQDLVSQWLQDRCVLGDDLFIPAREGHKDFKQWFFDNISDSFPAPSQKKFKAEMERLLTRSRDAANCSIYRGAKLLF